MSFLKSNTTLMLAVALLVHGVEHGVWAGAGTAWRTARRRSIGPYRYAYQWGVGVEWIYRQADRR